MRIMLKEEVMRKRLPMVLGIFFFLTITIFISGIVEDIKIADKSISIIANPILIIFMVTITVIGILKCREKYRYSIIADQLIVHKINSNEQLVVENVKLRDIEYIGKVSNFKSKLDIKCTRRYVCSFVETKIYCCVYRSGKVLKKFYFQPSESFINKVSNLLENEKKKVS